MGVYRQVCCVGELLIDFYCTDVGVSLQDGINFEKQAGGAPANVSAAIAKLGGNTTILGRVGEDQFGDFLENTLTDVNVDTSMLQRDPTVGTTMAFVSLQKDGERDFKFYRGADANLTLQELNIGYILASEILHFGSATATLGGSSLETYFSLMGKAKEEGKLITFDPNYRKDLWDKNTKLFVKLAKRAMAVADFVKMSEEELTIISGKSDLIEGILSTHELGFFVIAVTLGDKGTMLSIKGKYSIIPSIEVNSIDSTGAGDAFVGAILYQLSLSKDCKQILNDAEKMKEIILFANKVGALVCTKIGAITALPTINDVDNTF